MIYIMYIYNVDIYFLIWSKKLTSLPFCSGQNHQCFYCFGKKGSKSKPAEQLLTI